MSTNTVCCDLAFYMPSAQAEGKRVLVRTAIRVFDQRSLDLAYQCVEAKSFGHIGRRRFVLVPYNGSQVFPRDALYAHLYATDAELGHICARTYKRTGKVVRDRTRDGQLFRAFESFVGLRLWLAEPGDWYPMFSGPREMRAIGRIDLDQATRDAYKAHWGVEGEDSAALLARFVQEVNARDDAAKRDSLVNGCLT